MRACVAGTWIADFFGSCCVAVNCWPTPSNDGTCDVNIEYELENEGVTLHDVVISIPLPCVPCCLALRIRMLI